MSGQLSFHRLMYSECWHHYRFILVHYHLFVIVVATSNIIGQTLWKVIILNYSPKVIILSFNHLSFSLNIVSLFRVSAEFQSKMWGFKKVGLDLCCGRCSWACTIQIEMKTPRFQLRFGPFFWIIRQRSYCRSIISHSARILSRCFEGRLNLNQSIELIKLKLKPRDFSSDGQWNIPSVISAFY